MLTFNEILKESKKVQEAFKSRPDGSTIWDEDDDDDEDADVTNGTVTFADDFNSIDDDEEDDGRFTDDDYHKFDDDDDDDYRPDETIFTSRDDGSDENWEDNYGEYYNDDDDDDADVTNGTVTFADDYNDDDDEEFTSEDLAGDPAQDALNAQAISDGNGHLLDEPEGDIADDERYVTGPDFDDDPDVDDQGAPLKASPSAFEKWNP
jgi:hypothetical protein